MEPEIQFLSQIIDKVQTLAGQVGIIGEPGEILALLDIRMTELQQRVACLAASQSPLQRLVWALIGLDEPQLIAVDRQWAAVFWPPSEYPQYAGHTISWILGQEELAGDSRAKAFCDLLAEFLGPDHCVRAVNLKD